MSNPFLNASMEENTLDANDNNPLLKAEDPAKTAKEDGAKIANEFEYVESEAVEGENQKPDDAVIEESIKDTTTDINNIVKETDKTTDTLTAVASVAQEMYAVIQERGKVTSSEMFVIQSHMASLESHCDWVKDADHSMPSLEDFKTPGLQYTTSQVAMESVVGAVFRGLERLGSMIGKLVELGIGASRKYLNSADSKLKQASALMTALDGSHREAGLKEVSGSFAKALVVDGKAPDPTTILKTAAYTNAIAKEFLSGSIYQDAEKFTRLAADTLLDNTNLSSTKQPSGVMTSLCIVIGIAAASSGSILMVLPALKLISDAAKSQRTFKIDPAVTPQIFKMFPNIAKVNFSDPEIDDVFDCKRSLPLFDNKALYAYQLKSTLDPRNVHGGEFPSMHFNNGDTTKGDGFKLQALTSSQQKDVLTSAIAMLEYAKAYYGEYGTRVKSLYRINSEAIAKSKSLQKQGDNVGRSWAGALAASTMTAVYRCYWRGLLQDQSDFAAHLVKTAGNLIALVEASSAVAKANVAGNASQESLPVVEEPSNPFM